MSYRTKNGHATDLGLELLATDELRGRERTALEAHLHDCVRCRARAVEWQQILTALATLPPLEPGFAFDESVMARVRLPAARKAAGTPGWASGLTAQMRRLALGTAALWSAVVLAGAVWLTTRLEVSPSEIASGFLGEAVRLLWAGIIKIGATVHLSGLVDAWTRAEQLVPGPGFLSAVAVMTALSGIALWLLYRVSASEPVRINAHA